MVHVIRREDAPAQGWYPDPRQPARLRWWDGTDWTDHERVRPPSAVAVGDRSPAPAGPPSAQARSASPPPSAPPLQTAQDLRRQAATAAAAGNLSRDDMSAFVNEIRRATRGEIDRATGRLTSQATDLRSQLEPMVQDYGRRFIRFARRVAIFGAVLYIAYILISAQIQTGVVDFLTEQVQQFFDDA